VRLILFASLMVYAATADFIATSFIAHGHDHDHPLLRIEHKCVTNSVNYERSTDAAAPVAFSPALLVALPQPAPVVAEPAPSTSAVLRPPSPASAAFDALRC
jgi:hypothetical protein